MKIDLRKDRFKEIESCFIKMKDGKDNIPSATKRMGQVLNLIFHKNISVSVVYPRSEDDQFFVMSIFPSQSTLEALVVGILNNTDDQTLKKIWDETEDWNIEIDRRIFNENYVSITAKEMTALLLHEIGHIVYSNSVPQRLSRVMRFEVAKLNVQKKAILQNQLFRGVLELPIMNACCYDRYKTPSNVRKELQADVFVIKMGYGKELQSVLDKFLTSNVKNVHLKSKINKSEPDVDQDMKNTIKFSMEIIDDFEKRRAAVAKKNLGKLVTKVPSDFIRLRISDLSDKLTKSDVRGISDEIKMERVCEAAQRQIENYYMKEFFEFRTKRFKRIDPRVIDYIELQAKAIKNNDDKMILVNYIFTNLDQVNYRINVLNDPEYANRYEVPDSMNTLLRYRERLERAREYVINYKIPEIRYGLDISYPSGYEG